MIDVLLIHAGNAEAADMIGAVSCVTYYDTPASAFAILTAVHT